MKNPGLTCTLPTAGTDGKEILVIQNIESSRWQCAQRLIFATTNSEHIYWSNYNVPVEKFLSKRPYQFYRFISDGKNWQFEKDFFR